MEPTPNPVDELTVSESHALFEQRAKDLLNVSRLEFLVALDRGDYSERTEDPPVRALLALLPFAQAAARDNR